MSAERIRSQVQENSSGQGNGTELPDELNGLNWGAFFLNGIWGIGNKTTIALLALIPFVNLVMAQDNLRPHPGAPLSGSAEPANSISAPMGEGTLHNYAARDAGRWKMAQLTQETETAQKPDAKPAMKGKAKPGLDAIRAGAGRGDKKAISQLRVLAAKGNTDAQVLLGDLYLTGKGVFKNGSLAGTWYQRAAEKGNALGQYKIAIIYLKGVHLPLDPKEAGKWLKKAAQQGHAGARETLVIRLGETLPPIMKPKK